MNRICKLAFVTIMLLAVAFFACACSGEGTPYDQNDADGYTVSIRYDANGGFFATSTSVITDSYNLSNMQVGSNGMVSLGLLAPEDTRRGSSDTFSATKSGYFLVGWYAERTENVDSEGNVTYTYGKKWDFDTDVWDVDPSKTYTSSDPVLTLYAVWAPLFEINFVDLDTDEVLGTYTFNPLTTQQIQTPQWDKETGTMKMYRFPEKKGYTYDCAYYDADGTQPVGDELIHSGTILEDGTAQGHSMNVYVDWLEGKWYHIYTAEQLVDNANPDGHYILEADLDFTDETWPSIFATRNFAGSIEGNGYTIKNVTFKQTKTDVENTGLFGALQPGAVIENVTFENVTFTIEKGFFSVQSAHYGLFAGYISEDAVICDVQIKNSKLLINADAYFNTDDYCIGLIYGDGKADQIVNAEITFELINNDPEKYTIQLDEDGNKLTLIAKDPG